MPKNDIVSLFDRLRGVDVERQDQIREKAEKAMAQSGAPEEPGIEPDYSLEETGSLLVGGPAAGMAKRAGSLALRKGTQKAMDKLKQKGPPAPPPTFSEGVETGSASPGVSGFSKWIRGEGEPVKVESVSMNKPATRESPVKQEGVLTSYERGAASNPQMRAQLDKLREEYQSEVSSKSMNSPRAKELDKQIKALMGPRFE